MKIKIVMGDLNAKVSRGRCNTAAGPFGLGDSNERGDIWNEWYEENSMTVLNAWFKQHERNLYTWKSPGDLFRNQIDYFSINSRYRNSVIRCKTRPGVDCNSDNLLFAMVRCNLKKLRISKKTPQLDFKGPAKHTRTAEIIQHRSSEPVQRTYLRR